jgi:hypothetical protein
MLKEIFCVAFGPLKFEVVGIMDWYDPPDFDSLKYKDGYPPGFPLLLFNPSALGSSTIVYSSRSIGSEPEILCVLLILFKETPFNSYFDTIY